MKHSYAVRSVCSKRVDFELVDGLVKNVKFEGGCSGNTKGVSLLAEGREAEVVARILDGVICGKKKSSCPAELSKALCKALKKEAKANPKK